MISQARNNDYNRQFVTAARRKILFCVEMAYDFVHRGRLWRRSHPESSLLHQWVASLENAIR